MVNAYRRVNQMSHLKQKQISDNSCKAIIIDTILESVHPLTTNELSTAIASTFHILVSTQRLEETISSLVKDGVISLDTENHVSITPLKRIEFIQARAQETAIQEKATQQWIFRIQSHKEISSDLQTCLAQALPVFLRSLFIKHGVSSYELLTSKNVSSSFGLAQLSHTTAELFDSIYQNDLSELLPTIFYEQGCPEILEYLKHAIDKAVGYISEVISQDNLEMITASLQRLTLYLDTNTVYRLLNLQGKSRFESIRETLDFCTRNGVKLRISAETKKELAARLRYDSKVLLKYPMQTNLARAGYNYRTSDNYVSTYWRQAHETKISVEDFIEFYRNFDILLEQYHIEIEDTIIDEEPLVNRAKSLYEKLSLADCKREKSDSALWHDAFNLAYVQRMQRVDAPTSIETGCLFLSTDQSLLDLQLTDHELKECPPIVIVPSQLLQLFSFSKPDSGYEETFIKFFASSSLGISFQYDNNDIQEILSRIGHYQGFDVDVAERVLARQLVNSRYLTAETDAEKEDIVYNSISDELSNELQAVKAQVSSLTDINSQLAGDNTQLTAKQRAVEELLQQNETQYRAEKEKLVHDSEAVKTQLSKESTARSNAEKREQEIRNYSEAQEILYVDEKWKAWKKQHLWLFWGSVAFTIVIVSLSVFLFWLFKDSGYWGILGGLAIPCLTIPAGWQVFSAGKATEIKEKLTKDYRDKLSKSKKD